MNTRIIAIAGPLLVALSPSALRADPGDYGHMGDWFPGMGGHGVFGLFWLILLVVVVVLGVRWIGASGGAKSTPPSALEILKERYARGEIDDEEFQRRRRELERC